MMDISSSSESRRDLHHTIDVDRNGKFRKSDADRAVCSPGRLAWRLCRSRACGQRTAGRTSDQTVGPRDGASAAIGEVGRKCAAHDRTDPRPYSGLSSRARGPPRRDESRRIVRHRTRAANPILHQRAVAFCHAIAAQIVSIRPFGIGARQKVDVTLGGNGNPNHRPIGGREPAARLRLSLRPQLSGGQAGGDCTAGKPDREGLRLEKGVERRLAGKPRRARLPQDGSITGS